MAIALTAGVLLTIALGIYRLHCAAMYFESRGMIDYLHTKSSGGGGYNPLQEFVQPEVRHLNEVAEHRLEEDSPGEPPSYNEVRAAK
jgi:hypothetical protein